MGVAAWRPTQAGTLTPDAANAGDAWVACMRAGDFAGAWAIGDAMLSARDPATRDDPGQPYHLRWVWDGTLPDGRRVLVRCYHGLGDTLQFARFMPALRARAAHVTLEAQPELCPLLAGLPGVDRLVSFDVASPLPASACDVEIMELGQMLRATPAEAAACVPYLAAPAHSFGGMAAPIVGLCWSAGGWDVSRSAPLADLLQVCGGPGRSLVSLQRGLQAGQAAGSAFLNPCDADVDVVRTASLVVACSVVVTVDTMVAHLAGALGRPVLLLAKHDPDWRWPRSGQSCPWYPTMTVLHQHRPGDWSAVIDALRESLRAMDNQAVVSRPAKLEAG